MSVAGVPAPAWPWLAAELSEFLRNLGDSGRFAGGKSGSVGDPKRRSGDFKGSVAADADDDDDHRRLPLVVVTESALDVERVAECVGCVVGDAGADGHGVRVMVYPAWDVHPYDVMNPSVVVQGQRLAVMQAVQSGSVDVIVTSVPALLTRLPRSVASPVSVVSGEAIAGGRDGVVRRLVELGYVRVDVVQDVGEVAVRGGVVDVWPAAMPDPVRMELFDDEVESLRLFDPVTQKAAHVGEGDNAGVTVTLRRVEIRAVRDVVLGGTDGEARVEVFRERWRDMFPDGAQDELYFRVSEGLAPSGVAQYLPLFWEDPLPLLTDLLPHGARFVVPDNAAEQAVLWNDEVREAAEARSGLKEARVLEANALYGGVTEFMEGIFKFDRLAVQRLADGKADIALGWMAAPYARSDSAAVDVVRSRPKAMAEFAAAKRAEGWSVIVTAPTTPALAQLVRTLDGEGGPEAHPLDGFVTALGRGVGAWAVVAPFNHGWADPLVKLLVLTEADVFGDKIGRTLRPRRKKSAEEMIAHWSELRDGDYVVHEKHGIGRFGGLVTMEVPVGVVMQAKAGPMARANLPTGPAAQAMVRQDFLRIYYANEDRLMVPVENLDVLSRYKGAEAGNVVLDKLGTGGWEARKDKVKQDLLEMADGLIKTASARAMLERAPYDIGGDGVMYDEFCAGFPYTLTDDQASVMEEVEQDLLAASPMDRLVVGDVGFGKTEVALRAAFVAASNGRQVAVVCPTTLLARQHYDVFAQRFAGFPMQVGRLSRLVSTVESKTVKAGLASGEVDIVVGTHALLNEGVKFKNLGLVIVDEEQRFGVAHKERLKSLRAMVDVLTLTATPIPRTLQMAVGGVRGLSLITTPPVDRLAVQTYVLKWDNATLQEAIRREVGRGGQVYVVAPHIEDLGALSDSLGVLVPEVKVSVAHGQMDEEALEDVMVRFYAGETQVLLATTIIESGIDVPKANTLIVYRADRFGLAQLYQLRGRVGRSTRRAFAYFVVPDGPMGEDAVKRLQILQKLDGLGAGFMLASYDMDMRGFGNLLGKQQSGHIKDIGFELYAKMLREAVDERRLRRLGGEEVRGDEPLRSDGVQLKLGVSYLIPETYVPDVATRLQLYRRLANITELADLAEFKLELGDRFGKIPPDVDMLLQVMALRNRAQALNISKLDVGDKGVVVSFANGRFVQPAALMKFIMEHAGVVTVRPDQSIVFNRRLGEGERKVQGVGVILSELEGVAGILSA